ncbi:MAG: reverse transcriptase-like protein [Candidatus Saccharibacteria bacterium]|nr:reverse transcriptase-like protein [Candidatus Saccharibacteria bacterium]
MRQKISVRAMVKQDGKILLARRATGRSSILGKYELPGGSVEFREQPSEALQRYLRNHFSVGIETSQLFDVVSFIDPDDTDIQYVFVVYLVSLKAGESSIKLSSRYNKYAWHKLSDIQLSELTNSTQILLGLDDDVQPTLFHDVEHFQTDVETTSHDSLILYSDGGSRGNPGPSAAAFVVMNSREQVIADGGSYLGVTTNNQAEYQAVYFGLKKASEMGAQVIDFRLDSNLVVNQLNGVYKIKNRDLWPIYEQIKLLVPKFKKVTFSHVRREFNQLADGLVNKILDEQAGK